MLRKNYFKEKLQKSMLGLEFVRVKAILVRTKFSRTILYSLQIKFLFFTKYIFILFKLDFYSSQNKVFLGTIELILNCNLNAMIHIHL